MTRLALWVTALVGGLLVLARVPMSVGDADPMVAAFAVVRVVALGTGWYLIGITVLGVLARASRVPALVRSIDVMTVAPVRRLLHASMGASMTATLTMATLTTAPAYANHGPAVHDPPVLRPLRSDGADPPPVITRFKPQTPTGLSGKALAPPDTWPPPGLLKSAPVPPGPGSSIEPPKSASAPPDGWPPPGLAKSAPVPPGGWPSTDPPSAASAPRDPWPSTGLPSDAPVQSDQWPSTDLPNAGAPPRDPWPASDAAPPSPDPWRSTDPPTAGAPPAGPRPSIEAPPQTGQRPIGPQAPNDPRPPSDAPPPTGASPSPEPHPPTPSPWREIGPPTDGRRDAPGFAPPHADQRARGAPSPPDAASVEPPSDSAPEHGDVTTADPPAMRRLAPAPFHDPARVPDEPRAPEPPPRSGGTWVVRPGESFWSIAAGVAHGQSEAGITSYWLRLIEANRSRLTDPENVDLLFTDQELVLPTLQPP